MDLFVYYVVPHAAVVDVCALVRAMHATLSLDPSAIRLMRRAEVGVDGETWMEIYRDVDAAFEPKLAAIVATYRLDALTGPRHVERFTDVA